MRVVGAHKAGAVIETVAKGREGHSSAPGRGANAVMMAGEFIASLSSLGEELKQDRDEFFEPPYTTVQANVMSGGTAVNVLAREARVVWEYRALPDRDETAIFARAKARAGRHPSALPDGRAGSRLHDACPRGLSRPRARRRFTGGAAGLRAFRKQRRARGVLRHRGGPVPASGNSRGRLRSGLDRSGAQGRRIRRAGSARSLRRVPAPRGAARRAVSYAKLASGNS